MCDVDSDERSSAACTSRETRASRSISNHAAALLATIAFNFGFDALFTGGVGKASVVLLGECSNRADIDLNF